LEQVELEMANANRLKKFRLESAEKLEKTVRVFQFSFLATPPSRPAEFTLVIQLSQVESIKAMLKDAAAEGDMDDGGAAGSAAAASDGRGPSKQNMSVWSNVRGHLQGFEEVARAPSSPFPLSPPHPVSHQDGESPRLLSRTPALVPCITGE
jgi:hypothetical protein